MNIYRILECGSYDQSWGQVGQLIIHSPDENYSTDSGLYAFPLAFEPVSPLQDRRFWFMRHRLEAVWIE